jgi:four helix bundle protein
VKSAEDPDVFKLAHALTLRVYKITETFPKQEIYNLTAQTRRAASSICMNLLEGSMRLTSRDYRQFVGIARGSAGEPSYQLLLAKDLGYISQESYHDLRSQYVRVGPMLTRLTQSLNSDPRTRPRAR